MTTTERALSQRKAWDCENAVEPRCRCRCAGKLHGARRVKQVHGLTLLPAGDPHYVAPEPEHPAGPMRRVIAKHKHPLMRGRWKLKLDCNHVITRKQSQRVPKKLHCAACRTARPYAIAR